MNSNKRNNRLTIVDKQYLLRQIVAQHHSPVVQFKQRPNLVEVISQQQGKAA